MTERKNIVIAISGLHGVGKTAQARRIAEEFGLRHVSGGAIFRSLAREKNLSLIELSKNAEVSDEIDKLIDGRMVEEGKKGNVVIDSMLCAWFLKDLALIKIFLTAPDNIRFERIAKRDKKSFMDAYKETVAREASEISRFKKYYGLSISDVKDVCHLILSTEDLSEDDVFIILKSYIQLRLKNTFGAQEC
ncbi:MAG: AAA family ATPase [Nitrososphaeria archaeon]|nr:AAA family ATPase [Nitrososphaeria archaeon]